VPSESLSNFSDTAHVTGGAFPNCHRFVACLRLKYFRKISVPLNSRRRVIHVLPLYQRSSRYHNGRHDILVEEPDQVPLQVAAAAVGSVEADATGVSWEATKSRDLMSRTEQTAPTRARTELTTSKVSRVLAKLE
jgi:hypothetical protein